MALDLQYSLENFSLWFQGGIRRSVLIFVGICVVLLAPMYFLGILLSNVWNKLPANPNRFDDQLLFTAKFVAEKDWTISKTQVVPLATGESVLYVSVSNKENPLIGYFPFVYDVQILDKNGKALFNETQTSYILPGEIRYLVFNTKIEAAEIRLVRNSKTQPIYYNPNSKSVREASVQIVNQNLKDITFTRNLEISATVKNTDQRKIKKLDILYILRDYRQSVVGIGVWKEENLSPGQEISFKFQYPKPLERTATILDLQLSVNYLDTDNVFLP